MIDNNVTGGNYVLVFRDMVFTICYKQITYFFVYYIVARNEFLIDFRTPLIDRQSHRQWIHILKKGE